jgi:hypothetical protein
VKRAAFLLLAAAAFACGGRDTPTSPLDPGNLPHGTLSGTVTIGPNCPGPTTTNPCPTPPSAYAERKVIVLDEARTKVVATVDIDAHGFYRIDLLPAKYVVDLKAIGIDRSSDVPASVTIRANLATQLNINIDTGLR